MKRKGWAIVAAFVMGLASCSASDVVVKGLGPPDWACADGWLSHSIGIQGACSHHGGVVNKNAPKPNFLRDFLSGALDIFGVLCFGIALLGVFTPDQGPSRTPRRPTKPPKQNP